MKRAPATILSYFSMNNDIPANSIKHFYLLVDQNGPRGPEEDILSGLSARTQTFPHFVANIDPSPHKSGVYLITSHLQRSAT